jgi:hypothetical protein
LQALFILFFIFFLGKFLLDKRGKVCIFFLRNSLSINELRGAGQPARRNCLIVRELCGRSQQHHTYYDGGKEYHGKKPCQGI